MSLMAAFLFLFGIFVRTYVHVPLWQREVSAGKLRVTHGGISRFGLPGRSLTEIQCINIMATISSSVRHPLLSFSSARPILDRRGRGLGSRLFGPNGRTD